MLTGLSLSHRLDSTLDTLHTAHCTLHNDRLTPYTVHCTLHNTHCTLHTVHYTLSIIHQTLHTAHHTLLTTHYKLNITHCTLHALRSPVQTTHSNVKGDQLQEYKNNAKQLNMSKLNKFCSRRLTIKVKNI